MKVLNVTEDPPMLHVLALGKEHTINGLLTMERTIQAARKVGAYFESIEEVQHQINQVLTEQCQEQLSSSVATATESPSSLSLVH